MQGDVGRCEGCREDMWGVQDRVREVLASNTYCVNQSTWQPLQLYTMCATLSHTCTRGGGLVGGIQCLTDPTPNSHTHTHQAWSGSPVPH